MLAAAGDVENHFPTYQTYGILQQPPQNYTKVLYLPQNQTKTGQNGFYALDLCMDFVQGLKRKERWQRLTDSCGGASEKIQTNRKKKNDWLTVTKLIRMHQPAFPF